MYLAVSHDVLCKRLGVTALKVVPHHLGIPLGVAVHGVADQDHEVVLQMIRRGGYCGDKATTIGIKNHCKLS